MKLCGHSRLFFVVIILAVDVTLANRQPFKIGGIFESTEGHLEKAFIDAVEVVNRPTSTSGALLLEAVVDAVRPYDSFQTSKKVCNMIENGVVAVLGPQSEVSAAHVQSIASSLEIPHLEVRWDFKFHRRNFSLNLHPHPSSLSRAFFCLIKEHYQWKSFSIIYEGNEGLARMQELLKGQFEDGVTVKQLDAYTDDRIVLKEIKMSGETKIVVDCSPQKTMKLLKLAQDIGMMNHYFGYIITSLDMHAMDMEPFRNSRTNITGFRIVNPDISDTISRSLALPFYQNYRSRPPGKMAPLKTAEALIHDGVTMFANVFAKAVKGFPQIQFPSLSCNSTSKRSEHGRGIVEYLRLETMANGVTGNVSFDEFGRRQNYTLTLIGISPTGFNEIGTWHSTNGLNITQSYGEAFNESLNAMENITLRVISKLTDPFVMRRQNSEKYTGNDRYEGFCVDMMNKIAEYLKCSYTIEIVKDNAYGIIVNETGKWNGMIEVLINKEADVAVGDLTISLDREKVVDFTMPFMNLGISILFKKPTKNSSNLFSFLQPLSEEVWMYMVTAYLGVSIILFLLARFNPYDWENPHPCDPDPDELENKFGLLNSMWFTIGSLMQQGSDLAPKAISTRIMAGIWWFFTLIMISSYTANLAAFLTSERLTPTIQSASDLAEHATIKYGCVGSGTTRSFFEKSPSPLYQKMFEAMESAVPSVYTEGNEQGIQRVLAGNYAFLMESTTNEYHRERNCELTQIGTLLDAKNYALATPPGSPYRMLLSRAVLRLQQDGVLTKLKELWWKTKGGGKCDDEDSQSAASGSELGLPNVGGVFVVLLGGMGLACIVGVMEFVWKTRKTVQEERGEFWNEFRSELKFVVKCSNTTKPVRKADNKDGLSLPLTNDS